jgi:hypothetical protein
VIVPGNRPNFLLAVTIYLCIMPVVINRAANQADDQQKTEVHNGRPKEIHRYKDPDGRRGNQGSEGGNPKIHHESAEQY